jgi:hypothetical protein
LSIVAKITVSGDPQMLRNCRDEVNRLLEESGAGPFRELHTAERLEYEFRVQAGIPFPPFVEASLSFPDLTVEAQWSEAALGRGGRAIIRNGALTEQAARTLAPEGAVSVQVRAAADGSLELAVACARWRDAWHGYAIAAGEHAFFRISGSAQSCELSASDGVEAEWAERWTVAAADAAYRELAPREAIAEEELRELDRIAREFTREWIWFDESPPEETAVERQRFAAYGYVMQAANLRAEKLRQVLQPDGDGLAFGSFGEDARWVPELLRRHWLKPGAAG